VLVNAYVKSSQFNQSRKRWWSLVENGM
jgi:hypothetical protein